VPARRLEGPERVEGRKAPIHQGKYFFIEYVAIVRCTPPSENLIYQIIALNGQLAGSATSRGKLS
jgi:hypothetical protein